MKTLRRMKNRAIAKVLTAMSSLSRVYIDAYRPWEADVIPWTPVTKPLAKSMVAMVTTAGVHHRDQRPFDMENPEGDPSFRALDLTRPVGSLMITHDYYDHTDADRDLNIVFPIERLRELADEGIIGRVADVHYGFMGHIDGRHIPILVEETAPAVARRLKDAGVDVVLLTPG